jgi:4'-phosphopantetheinyl transferase EntD
VTIYAESFINESPARQLGALAATLGRIASSAEKETRAKAILPMLNECLQFIEWTLSQQSDDARQKLQNLSMMLKLWRDAWEYAQTNENLRRLLSIQAKQWSDQTLEYSGLLIS